MDETAFAEVADRFAAFHRRLAPRFGRREAQRRAEQYLRGLLVQRADRRNAENLAEAVEGATPRALQRFLTEAPWDAEALLAEAQAVAAARLSTPDGVFVIDETGFPKQGSKSVGVARQYCGTLGKVANCQVGVVLAYAAARGGALVDRRLYLPQAWTADAARRAAAGVPADVAFQTKAELGLAMLAEARRRGHLAGTWVTADEQYGQVPTFRDALEAAGWTYVLEIPQGLPLFAEPAATAVPAWSGRGRRPRKPRLAAGAAPATTAGALLAAVAETEWQDLAVAEGAQGPRVYRFAARRVWESREGLPGRATWLVLRRNPDGTEPKAYLANAPAATPLATLAAVGARRWAVETAIQQAKGEAGLDEYEARGWRAWHHHTALALLAAVFLLDLQQGWGGKGGRADRPPGQPPRPGAAAAPDLGPARPPRLVARHAHPQLPRHPVPRPAPRPFP